MYPHWISRYLRRIRALREDELPWIELPFYASDHEQRRAIIRTHNMDSFDEKTHILQRHIL